MNFWQWYELFRMYGNRRRESLCKAYLVVKGERVRCNPPSLNDTESGISEEIQELPEVAIIPPKNESIKRGWTIIVRNDGKEVAAYVACNLAGALVAAGSLLGNTKPPTAYFAIGEALPILSRIAPEDQ